MTGKDRDLKGGKRGRNTDGQKHKKKERQK